MATSIAAFIDRFERGPCNRPVRISSYDDFERTFGGLHAQSEASYAIQQFFLNGGTDAWVVRVEELTEPGLRGVRAAKTGLFALEDVDLFNILCVPAAAGLAHNDMNAFYHVAEQYCDERRGFVIVDIPSFPSVEEMQAWLAESVILRHRNAATYFPRIRIADPLHQHRLRSISASGTIAGLYGTLDATRGIWKSPAGTVARLLGVQALECDLSDAENAVLNSLGVNCLRELPDVGNVVWGARTLAEVDQQPSEGNHIGVRRLALFLEESLSRGTKWVVFEPNAESLWSQIRLSIEAFMHNLFRQGAFRGNTPREAYFVKCDRETMTQDDIDFGRVKILVGFAALRPAEFVILRIQQGAGQGPAGE